MIFNDLRSIERWNQLPEGYTKLNWLQGDGNTTASRPYINLGFYFQKTDNFKIEIDAQITSIRASNNFFGKYGSTGANSWRVIIGGGTGNFSAALGEAVNTGIAVDTARHIFSLDRNTMKWQIDNQSGNLTNNSYNTNTSPWWLFGWQHASTQYAQWSNAKIYDFKAYLDDEIYSYCLPAMRDSDSVVGMYDVVRKQFLTNAGTGSFTYG